MCYELWLVYVLFYPEIVCRYRIDKTIQNQGYSLYSWSVSTPSLKPVKLSDKCLCSSSHTRFLKVDSHPCSPQNWPDTLYFSCSVHPQNDNASNTRTSDCDMPNSDACHVLWTCSWSCPKEKKYSASRSSFTMMANKSTFEPTHSGLVGANDARNLLTSKS